MLAGGACFCMQKGEAMEQIGNIKVLFITGFGPIVRDTTASRNLYRSLSRRHGRLPMPH